jgi:UTP--glucose-1-phosphate uridylyltransferase
VLCAAPVAAGEAVAVLYPDDMIDAEVPVTRQLLDVYRRYPSSAVIALREVPDEDTHLYGIVEGERIEERLYLIKRIVEKPPRGKAPSNLAIIGRYILPPEMFPVLRQLRPSADGEIQLAEGLAELSRRGRALGYLFSGTRYDLGYKLGYVQATVGYALKRPELRERFKQWLREVVRDEK